MTRGGRRHPRAHNGMTDERGPTLGPVLNSSDGTLAKAEAPDAQE
ncbi:hypothetical protein CSB93_1548 [Pseudomonas paraeruginosa]|uniref:Uncharacterized protein n=1 Tax=Pseudomonas paraeruginosa TaxID=2994495 RepID=A0A2R3IWE9_9PSED|nr:hypothetical protein CSB93_1548 [Pseudomonas paraeruginosa]AWE91332.1 hypothetical protein CSC28_0316 [Pseudomonas paraeruginosa]